MNENSSVVWFRQPDEIDDPLTNILRTGARQLLAQAVEMEAEAFLAAMKDLKLPDGRDRGVRHGHGPERTIQTGIGPVEVSSVKIRDRGAAIDGARIRFPRRSCRNGLGGRRAWMRCCQCFICAAYQRATSRKRWRRFWARRRRTCRQRWCPG